MEYGGDTAGTRPPFWDENATGIQGQKPPPKKHAMPGRNRQTGPLEATGQLEKPPGPHPTLLQTLLLSLSPMLPLFQAPGPSSGPGALAWP
eukprot:g38127.t1